MKRRNKVSFVIFIIVTVLIGVGFNHFFLKGIDYDYDHSITRTSARLGVLHGAVNMFKLDTGRYPSQQAGLLELVREPDDVTGWAPGGYLESRSLPKDAWGNDFVYQLNPASEKPFHIMSYGADGKPGGEGKNNDLYSTESN